MQLHLSRFAGFLRDETAGEIQRCGIYHRLTGAVVVLNPTLAASLDELQAATPLPPSILAGEHGEVAALVRTGLLVQTADDEIAQWDHMRLVIPLRHPAAILRVGDAIKVAYPADLHLCTLPRTATRPRLVEETFAGPEAELLRLALGGGEGVAWASLFRDRRAELARSLDILTHPSRQLVRLVPPNAPPAARECLVQSFVRQPSQSSGGPWTQPASAFYGNDIDDAAANFDWDEPTVSHSFRTPTAALGGSTFGDRLARFLARIIDAGEPQQKRPFALLEVGAGLGHVAQSIVPVLGAALGGRPIVYRIADVSPALQQAQRAALADVDARFEFVNCDAQHQLPKDSRFDLVILNEVIADFEVAWDVGRRRWSHSGLASLLCQLGDLLHPGGKVFLSEYGSLHEAPRPVTHLAHSEYSIDFNQLGAIARDLGYDVQIQRLDAVLGFEPDALLLAAQQEGIFCLNHLLYARHIEPISYRAHDAAEFAQAVSRKLPVEPLWPRCFPARMGLYFGPDIRQFLCAILSPRPVQAARAAADEVRLSGAAERVASAAASRNLCTADLLQLCAAELEACDAAIGHASDPGQRQAWLRQIRQIAFLGAAHCCPAFDEVEALPIDVSTLEQAVALAERSMLATVELGLGEVDQANAHWLMGVLRTCELDLTAAASHFEQSAALFWVAGERDAAAIADACQCVAKRQPPAADGMLPYRGGEEEFLAMTLAWLRRHVALHS